MQKALFSVCFQRITQLCFSLQISRYVSKWLQKHAHNPFVSKCNSGSTHYILKIYFVWDRVLLHSPDWLHTRSKPPASASEFWDDRCASSCLAFEMFLIHYFIKQLAEFLTILCILEGEQINAVSFKKCKCPTQVLLVILVSWEVTASRS